MCIFQQFRLLVFPHNKFPGNLSGNISLLSITCCNLIPINNTHICEFFFFFFLCNFKLLRLHSRDSYPWSKYKQIWQRKQTIFLPTKGEFVSSVVCLANPYLSNALSLFATPNWVRGIRKISGICY